MQRFLYGMICMIGIFECGHLAGVLLGCSITECGYVVLGLLALLALCGILGLIVFRKLHSLVFEGFGKACKPGAADAAFVLLAALQIGYLFTADILITPGDIMLETVNSFLATDEIYQVSPLTGKVMAGMPFRYEILCLPTLYTLLCKWFGGEPTLIVGRIVPVIVLCMTYVSYYLLGTTLFGREKQCRKKRMWFLVMVGVIFLLCESMVYMEGYGVLHGGYLGTTIRNSILVPLCLSAVLERKWVVSVMCILAEACIVWTFWGLGVCALVAAGMFLIDFLYHCEPVRKNIGRMTSREEDIS